NSGPLMVSLSNHAPRNPRSRTTRGPVRVQRWGGLLNVISSALHSPCFDRLSMRGVGECPCPAASTHLVHATPLRRTLVPSCMRGVGEFPCPAASTLLVHATPLRANSGPLMHEGSG